MTCVFVWYCFCCIYVFCILITAVSFGAGHELYNYVKSAVIPLEESFCDAYEFPLTHWIMMSLGYGGYQQEDVDFTVSFDSYEKKKEAGQKFIYSFGNPILIFIVLTVASFASAAAVYWLFTGLSKGVKKIRCLHNRTV